MSKTIYRLEIITNSQKYFCKVLKRLEEGKEITDEERLDKILVERGLVASRVRAERMIKEVGVLVNGKLINKTGKKFPLDIDIEVIQEDLPWVSRGALKLLKALEAWNPIVQNSCFLDVGASTGGFTEVLLSRGARKIYAVDVGTDQLHPRLKADNRVVNLEKTHVREINSNIIEDIVDGCVIDVSFISLEKIFPFIHHLIKQDGFVIALVKPQFEVGKNEIGKGGIVKNVNLYPKVIDQIRQSAAMNNLIYMGHVDSPILGGDGNREFLMYLKKK